MTNETDHIAKREEWLTGLALAMLPVIGDRAKLAFPPFRITCGFPSRGGELGKKKRTRGQCWSAAASGDKHAEIFVSPVEDDARQIGEIIAHELIHAALPEAGHKGPFVRAAKALGYEKPFTQSNPTPDFRVWADPLIAAQGPYPHHRLNAMTAVGAKKKQTARLLKAECPECGYTVRVTRKWVVEMGAPLCPTGTEMMVDGIELGGDDGGDEEA